MYSRILCAALIIASLVPAAAEAPPKKLIEYGWDVPPPSFVATHIREMEKQPFEGVIVRVPNIGTVFANKKWDESQVAAELAALERIEWRKFTDNFVIMYAASSMDWFSDADWECVLHNVALCAKAAKLGRCKGLCFDAEPYGKNPWHYPSQARAAEKSFAEYQAMARRRGAQFMAKIQEILPAPVIHTFFQLSYFPSVASLSDPAERERRLAREYYGLLPAFLNGMLDVANPGTRITDGNESSYYYTTAEEYFRAFHNIKQTALSLVAPENRAKYLAQVQCSQALYVDYLFKYWSRSTPATHMTPEERARWFEHNVYWALKTTDEYVWLYSEKMNWWKGENIPHGLPEAIVAAKEKLAAQQPLGFDMAAIITRAKAAEEKEIRARLEDRQARIQRIGSRERPPVIDGQLDDPVWQRVPTLDAFRRPAAGTQGDLKAQTIARVAYDAEKLYVAIRCEEPTPDKMQVVGDRRDDDVWLGESVDLFLSPGKDRTPYVHLILNPANVRWDARCAEESDLSWNPDYQTAVSVGKDAWCVEIALPWKALGRPAPKRGEKLLANIGRQRAHAREISSWSICLKGFVEPDRFGTWIFR